MIALMVKTLDITPNLVTEFPELRKNIEFSSGNGTTATLSLPDHAAKKKLVVDFVERYKDHL